MVKSTLRGIRRRHGCLQKQARPLTLTMLQRLARVNRDFSALRNARDRALLLIGFAGGFRRAELASLRIDDVTLTRKGAVIRLRSTKTDQYARGREVAIPYASSISCPVKALRRWLDVLKPELEEMYGSNSIAGLPLFASIDRHENVCSGLNAASIGWILIRRMRECGLDTTGYSAHSLRAGLVTSAAKAGVPIWSIKRQTGHRSDATVQRYIRNLNAFECNAASRLM